MMEYDDARKRALRAEYVGRINRVMDYIEANLAGDLSLGALARVANFSAFHFHRVFNAIVGETLNQFIQRRRVEKAAGFLLGSPTKSVTEIALDCGFSGSAAFARAFKRAFGVSASEYRRTGEAGQSKIGKTNGSDGEPNGKGWKDLGSYSYTIDLTTGNQLWRYAMSNTSEVKIEVKEMPGMPIVYVRHMGPYKGDPALFERLFGKLCGWAGPRGLIRPPQIRFLCIYYDDPDVTEDEKLRVDVAMTVPAETQVDGEVGKNVIPAGKYAVGRFEVLPHEFGQAWSRIMGGWLPQSGYQCDDRPCFELYHNDPKQHPEGRCIVDICVPVKPL
ncbi:MAG: AraC family transcriptional regulator [Phycisphaerae bacterium]|nr:AraC family transcriptional regulator [Phycisphaerae bacterium]